MKIACHKSSDRACRVCEYRYVCDLSAYHKHNDVPAQNPLQVDSVLDPTSDNPIANRAVALAIEALHLTIGRWGSISGNIDEQGDLSARFGSINEIIGQLQEVVDVLKTHAVMERGSGDKSVQLVDDLRTDGKGATGKRSAAFGRDTLASGENAFAEGENTFAEGKASHAGGTSGTRASGSASFAHGSGCHAVSKRSVAMGVNCTAGDTAVDASGEEINTDSFAMGKDNRATHKASAVFGGDNRSSRSHQMVVGHDNADNPDALFVVGNGAGKEDAQRSNAFEVLENGNAVVSNDVIFGGGKSLTDELNSKATYESGEMAAADLYAWYANNEYRIEKAQYNLIGDYCMLSLVGVKTIAGWNVVYYSLPVSCAVPAHGFFKTQDGHNCYWAIASEPDTNVMVLRIASLEEGTALTQSAASLQICYKYK